MSKLSKRAKIIISLGILVALMPIIGLHGGIESTIVIILGLVIATSMYFAEKRVSTCDDCNDDRNAFKENGNNPDIKSQKSKISEEKNDNNMENQLKDVKTIDEDIVKIEAKEE